MDISTLILIIVNIFLVIGTWAAIVLAYRSRPIVLEVKKKHTDDLRKLIKRWKSEILQDAHDPASEVVHSKPQPFDLSVEKEFLFSDLQNHMPSELDLFDVWNNYKKHLYDYNLKRYKLFQAIRQETINRLKLPIGTKLKEIEKNCCEGIYTHLFNVAEGEKQIYTEFNYAIDAQNNTHQLRFKIGNYAIVTVSNTDKELLNNVRDAHMNWLNELTQSCDNSEFVKDAKELIKLDGDLHEDRQNLERNLNNYMSIPVLPKNCKYTGWALSSVLDPIKGTINWIRKKISDC
ncbi:hypothetical protein [Candidatus Borrarchaeum sp.]|uniref:hypothetical protein n=1 Tax=Candidatus Borrarchaeum sp. TaxID=2846742 RepID=UPI00257FA830|nr:hypothetical protein [Candidatus Borrarchaeum sp.]